MANLLDLAGWTKPAIDAECVAAHGRYSRELALHYTQFFAEHPALRGEHRHCARDIEAALPKGWGRLAERIAPRQRHRHYLSGKSSQILALGLLGPASEKNLGWLESLLQRPGLIGGAVDMQFEYEIDASLLNERPRVTTVDYLVRAPEIVVCAETKWSEAGLGGCSCARQEAEVDQGDPTIGECAARIEQRTAYWDTARDIFRLPERAAGQYCPISTCYQAIRNVAAARALAREHQCYVCAFLLVYDENNPYFRPGEKWPGWPALLKATLPDRDDFLFRAISWQQLVKTLSLDDDVKAWAREKHRLAV
jgi:hypothetical protein